MSCHTYENEAIKCHALVHILALLMLQHLNTVEAKTCTVEVEELKMHFYIITGLLISTSCPKIATMLFRKIKAFRSITVQTAAVKKLEESTI